LECRSFTSVQSIKKLIIARQLKIEGVDIGLLNGA
jgi:hypothetical protein